jgi:hypothetical protein
MAKTNDSARQGKDLVGIPLIIMPLDWSICGLVQEKRSSIFQFSNQSPQEMLGKDQGTG